VFSANVENRIQRENPDFYSDKKRLTICGSIYAMGAGVILVILGSMIASAYGQTTMMNAVGFGMLLVGIGVSTIGLSSVVLETVKITLSRGQHSKVKTPKQLFSGVISLGIGVAFLVVGTILAKAYAKDTLFNDVGFGMLITGIAILCLSASGVIVSAFKIQFYSQDKVTDEPRPRTTFGSSIWAIGIGTMLLIIGFILSGNFAKNTIINYTGFGMLLSGAGIFVYGLFETAKASVVGYLNYKLVKASEKQEKMHNDKRNRAARFNFAWKNAVHTSSIFNIAGVITAVCLLFFSIWQLDLIVSGPVWWSSGESGIGTGTGWSHPNGAYANDYFQCFLWKTTIGQAYDTLFLLMFISFIILFISTYFWPKHDRPLRVKQKDENHEPPPKNLQTAQEQKSSQPETTPEPAQPTHPQL
jgi:hypothetical protein